MKGFARVAVIFLALVALVVGFVGATATLDTFQPANAKVTTPVQFEVKAGDTTASVAQRLQSDGLIRNALLFRVWARYKKLDRGIEQGVYTLSPNMTMDQIIQKLLTATPDQIVVRLPEGMRVTQYPDYIQGLPNFKAADFLTTVKTGVEPDGTKLWQKYWYIQQPGSKVAYALEGYLYPSTYYFLSTADAKTVIEKMVTQLGIELCPGPANQPDAYITNAAQCRQHATTVNGKNIFDLMRAAYPDTKSDVDALHDALLIASFTAREIANPNDAAGVAAVYHNRYLNVIGKAPGADVGLRLGSDPSVEYARDTETPPTNGKWWADLGKSGNDVAPSNPYNTYTQDGLPPGPIANPYWPEIVAAAAPQSSPYFYFVSNKCGKILYAKTSNDFANIEQQMNSGNC